MAITSESDETGAETSQGSPDTTAPESGEEAGDSESEVIEAPEDVQTNEPEGSETSEGEEEGGVGEEPDARLEADTFRFITNSAQTAFELFTRIQADRGTPLHASLDAAQAQLIGASEDFSEAANIGGITPTAFQRYLTPLEGKTGTPLRQAVKDQAVRLLTDAIAHLEGLDSGLRPALQDQVNLLISRLNDRLQALKSPQIPG